MRFFAGILVRAAGKHPANRRVSEVGEKSRRNPESTAATEGPPDFSASINRDPALASRPFHTHSHHDRQRRAASGHAGCRDGRRQRRPRAQG